MSARYGRASQTEPESDMLREVWGRASKLPPHPSGGEWVPWEAVRIKEDILPRDRQDEDAIEQYAGMLDELPPIVVQRGTFVLIEGKHRLLAASKVTDFVRITELDVADADLWERAFEENAAHGVRLTSRERSKAARKYLTAHPDLSDGVIAKWAGIDRNTVMRWRHADAEKQQADDQQRQDAGVSQVATLQQPDGQTASGSGGEMQQPAAPSAPERRTGADGKSYPARAPQRASAPPPSPPKPTTPPSRPVKMLSLVQVLSESPTELAGSVEIERIRTAIEEAEQTKRWLDRYITALTERAAVPF